MHYVEQTEVKLYCHHWSNSEIKYPNY